MKHKLLLIAIVLLSTAAIAQLKNLGEFKGGTTVAWEAPCNPNTIGLDPATGQAYLCVDRDATWTVKPWYRDKTFLAGAVFGAAAESLDGWTTAQPGPHEHCQMEAGNPWLYGREPTVPRIVGDNGGR